MAIELNPQQIAFKNNYCNPNSETFGNAQQSAINAGFSKEYAKNITRAKNGWVAGIVRNFELLDKAEKVLEITLGFVHDEDNGKARLAQDSAKFVSSRLGKKKWADRTEHTGADGKDLPSAINIIQPVADVRAKLHTDGETVSHLEPPDGRQDN